MTTIAVFDSTEQLEAEIRQRMISDGLPASEATDLVLGFDATTMMFTACELSEPSLRHYARAGIIARMNEDRHQYRTATDPTRRPEWDPYGGKQRSVGAPSPHGEEWEDYYERYAHTLAGIEHAGADGATRPLIEFTLSDCEAFREVCLAQARGWTERADVMKTASGLLRRHGLEVVRDLPEDELDRLSVAVESAWRK